MAEEDSMNIPESVKTFYRGWKIVAGPGKAIMTKAGERFYANPAGLDTDQVMDFCKRKVDRLEHTVTAYVPEGVK